MGQTFNSTYQRVDGFRRVKAKASGRSLGSSDDKVQSSLHLHLRENGQPKQESTDSPGEQLYALTVTWINWRVYLDLYRHDGDRARVAQAVGATEAEAWKEIQRQLALLDL